MANRTNPSSHTQQRPIYGSTTVPRSNTTNHPIASLLRQLQSHAPNYSGQLFGFLALLISGGILLLLTGITVTVSVLSFIAFLPLIIISSPIWIPLFLLVTGFLSLAGFLFGTASVVSWTYRYFKGMHPVGSDQVDYARSRIYDTAAHVKDYAGGYIHGKVKDAAPGAWKVRRCMFYVEITRFILITLLFFLLSLTCHLVWSMMYNEINSSFGIWLCVCIKCHFKKHCERISCFCFICWFFFYYYSKVIMRIYGLIFPAKYI